MKDIVKRLLEMRADRRVTTGWQCDISEEAAKEIERLRDALEEITNGVYAAPERLREIAALALKVPNEQN